MRALGLVDRPNKGGCLVLLLNERGSIEVSGDDAMLSEP